LERREEVDALSEGTKSKARTKIGKAVEANEKEINLAVAGLILQIDAKIEALQGERPNSDEAIAERDAQITKCERKRAELEHIQTMVAAFKKGTVKEAKVVKSVKTFADGVASWWNKGHDAILTKTFDMGLFTTAVGVCSMAGAGGKMAVAVSAVLVGGKPVAQALKGLIPKRFTAD
jgi:membrane-bound inhibitor of C-type lysozyme